MREALRQLILALALALPILAGGAARADWPIDDFTPVFEEPGSDLYSEIFYAATSTAKDLLEMVTGTNDPELERKRQLALEAWSRLTRRYLREIARRYAAAGLLPPNLGPVVERNGEKSYVVYIVEPSELPPYLRRSFDEGAWAYQETGCAPGPFDDKKMVVARSLFGVGNNSPDRPAGGLTGTIAALPHGEKLLDLMRFELPQDLGDEQDFFYVLAHELFHAVQSSHEARYGWKGLCHTSHDTHRWITEGMADAAAVYVAGQKFPDFLQGKFGRRHGARNYAAPLNSERPNQDWTETSVAADIEVYRTSSFWRYLVERDGSLEVLARLLSTSPEENSRAGRIKWLDRFIRDEFTKYGLYHFWPEFITEYASYGGFRYRQAATGRGAETIEHAKELNREWLLESYLACSEISLTPDNTQETVHLSPMEGISASCVHVEWTGFKDLVEAQIEIIGPDLALLDQLHVGGAYYHDRKANKVWTCYQNRGLENSPKPWCNGKELATTGPELGKYAKSFGSSMPTFSGDGEATFIISNVAVEPWKTRKTFRPGPAREDEPKFRFGLDQTEGAAELGPPYPGNRKGTGSSSDPSPLPRQKSLAGMTVQKFATPTPERDEEAEYGYGIVPHPGRDMPFGYTGPFYGDVYRARVGESENLPVGSWVCRVKGMMGRETPIGTVLESSEEQLRVKIAADLCRCRTIKMQSCSVVDRFEGTLKLTSGWRHHQDTEARKIPTRGQQINDERFDRNMGHLISAVLRGDSRTRPHEWSAADPDPLHAGGGDADDDDGGPAGSGGGSAALWQECTCTCEEGLRLLDHLEGGADHGDLTQEVVCTNQCLTEYRSCAAN